MQTKNKFMDDIGQMMTNAMGVAQGAKDEAETAMKGLVDRWLAVSYTHLTLPTIYSV